jgi:hypothetical protein
MADGANPRAVIGANKPPLTPYEACKLHIEDLMIEARNWCDGAKVENQDQADVVSRLIEDFRLAHQAADDARKVENEPFDAGKAEVQARYAPLIADTKTVKGKTVLADAALKAALKPFLDAERPASWLSNRRLRRRPYAPPRPPQRPCAPRRRMTLAPARQLRIWLRLRASPRKTPPGPPMTRRRPAAVRARLGLKTFHKPYLTDRKAALMHYAANRPDDLVAFLVGLAEADVREGKRQIPGFDVREETRL